MYQCTLGGGGGSSRGSSNVKSWSTPLLASPPRLDRRVVFVSDLLTPGQLGGRTFDGAVSKHNVLPKIVKVGPGPHCSPRHGMPFNSINEGSDAYR